MYVNIRVDPESKSQLSSYQFPSCLIFIELLRSCSCLWEDDLP